MLRTFRFLRLLFSASRFCGILTVALALAAHAATPVVVTPVTAKHGMVSAGHPDATAAGLAVLQAGGNAIDAAVATSMALGVAEPYASGLGGKLNLVYYDAATKKTYAIGGFDQASSSLDVAAYLKLPPAARSTGWTSVCVPGLPAAIWLAHQKWGSRPWAEDLAPAIKLAREGFNVLPKTRTLFADEEKKLRSGDPDIARIYLPGGQLPAPGSRLVCADLAHTLELIAAQGADGFYRGPVAASIVAESQKHGGSLTLDDFAHYQATLGETVSAEVFGRRIEAGPPPSTGAALFLPILKALENETWAPGGLRVAANLDKLGRYWQVVQPRMSTTIADVPGALDAVKKLLDAKSIAEIRRRAAEAAKNRSALLLAPSPAGDLALATSTSARGTVAALTAPDAEAEAETALAAALPLGYETENLAGSTTHFVVVDAHGNIVSATQSTSLHFGAGVVGPGTGVVLNDTMSDFAFASPKSVNYVAPGKRPRTTTAPAIVFRDGKPVLAIGLPGAGRIPTAMLQVLLDHFAFNRPLEEAIGDTRLHLVGPTSAAAPNNVWQVENSFPDSEAAALRALGWTVNKVEAPGRGNHFGGFNAIALAPDGTLTGYADPRRTNQAMGY